MVVLIHFSKNTAQTAFCALSWTCILIQNTFKKSSDSPKNEFQVLIETQAILTLSICAAEDKKLTKKTHHLLCSMWNSVDSVWVFYADGISKLDPTPHSLIFGSYFLKFLKLKNQNELILKCKVSFILCCLLMHS